MKKLLRRVPLVRRSYAQMHYILTVIRDGFLADPVELNDQAHLDEVWDFGGGPDRDRWQRIIHLVREVEGARWGRVLEIGCAEGHATVAIADYADSLVAGDISPVARDRAAERLSGASHVEIVPLDLTRDELGVHDVVFAMDVLEFVHGRRSLDRVIEKLVAAVRGGGLLVVSMCRCEPAVRSAWWQRWLPEGADDVLPLFEQRPELDRLHLEPHPTDGVPIPGYLDHLIALFRGR